MKMNLLFSILRVLRIFQMKKMNTQKMKFNNSLTLKYDPLLNYSSKF